MLLVDSTVVNVALPSARRALDFDGEPGVGRHGVRARVGHDPELSFLQKVTPYSLRRGHISLRVLAGEDVKRIADECGTSTAMIHRHYLHELDVRHELPDDFSFDGAVEAARRDMRHLRGA